MQKLSKAYLGIIVAFLYAPIFVLIAQSFNASRYRGHWTGFTTEWYASLLEDEDMIAAFIHTLTIGLTAALCATLLGLVTALAMRAMGRKAQMGLRGLANVPLLNADIVTGISLMLLFLGFGLRLGYDTILLAHIVICLPYALLCILPQVLGLDRVYYEAAVDLGASPWQAFRKVLLPELYPGIAAAFLLSFAMSADDFIVTYFTKGAGIDTLTTAIYAQLKLGIHPEMYALSTLFFVGVLAFVALLLGNYRVLKRRQALGGVSMKKILALLFACLFAFLAAGCDALAEDEEGGDDTLYIYSWGDYLDEDVIAQFEEETGITVVLDEYDTNESMYPRVKEGATSYDLICPSDYMIQKMEQNDLLQPLDWSLLPNTREYIGTDYLKQAETYDPGNRYSVPYCWGTVGILYNTTMVDEPVDSWAILFDPKYKDSILMQDSARDAFMIPLCMMGVSQNTTDEAALTQARDMLLAQKPLVQAYGVDDIRDKLAGGEAALGVIFSGEAINLIEANPDLAFCPAPKEGTNLWMDGWVIPKSAKHVENAHRFIDFLSRPEIAAKNFESLGYSTPNTGVKELVEEDMDEDELAIAFPSPDVYLGQETYQYLGEAMDKLYTKLWLQVKVE